MKKQKDDDEEEEEVDDDDEEDPRRSRDRESKGRIGMMGFQRLVGRRRSCFVPVEEMKKVPVYRKAGMGTHSQEVQGK